MVEPHLWHPRMLCNKPDVWKEIRVWKDSLGLTDDAQAAWDGGMVKEDTGPWWGGEYGSIRGMRKQLHRDQRILKPLVCGRKPGANYLSSLGACAPGPREKSVCGEIHPTLKHPHLLREALQPAPFSGASAFSSFLLRWEAKQEVCPSQVLGLPELRVVGSHCFHISLTQGLQGEVQGGLLQLCLGCGPPG